METSSELDLELGTLPPDQRTPPAEIVAALRGIAALDGMSDQDYLWLATHGIERKVGPGVMLFREGDPPIGMNIMLRGEVHIRRAQSGNISFFIARIGQMSGILPFSRMKGYGGDGYTVGDVWTLDILKEQLPRDARRHPVHGASAASPSCSTASARSPASSMQAEKLTALGKLAANLAHELNNPASAAQRSAASLFGELREFGDQK